MDKNLKLYVWKHVLSDYTSGMAVAMAYSAEEAVELLKKAGLDQFVVCFEGTKLDGVEPIVYEVPAATWVFGGS